MTMADRVKEREIERFEKYREAYSWWDYQQFCVGRRITGSVKDFAYFYAMSDWDDASAAFQEWTP